MENQNAYVKPVTLKNILKFAVPTIAMTVFMSFIEFDRYGRAFGDQPDSSRHPARYRRIHDACHRRQRSHHEKNGRTEERGGKG